MTKFIGENIQNNAKNGIKSEKNQKKLHSHDTYFTPLKDNKIVLSLFNFKSYKSNQEEIINYMKKHKSSIVIQKTNFGKSLCFYATALQSSGLCIVIEPLISLIHNQVSKLNKIYRKFALAFTSETQNKEKKLKNLKKVSISFCM